MRPRATRFHGHPDDWPDDEWDMWKRLNPRPGTRQAQQPWWSRLRARLAGVRPSDR